MILAGGIMILSGCVSTSPEGVPSNDPAHYGEYPTNYEQVVRSFYEGILIDPESVRYSFIRLIGPHRGGYLVCARLNSKNRMGGYTGATTDALTVRDGRVIQRLEGAVLDNGWGFGRNLCEGAS